MEGQQRANAAQLAARNIKQAKSRHRKTPIKSNGNVQQSMQFGGTGGLFGGSGPPTSTFDFAAPGGISFPPSQFGNGNIPAGNGFSSPDISENEADPRVDTTGEEAARRHRGFQTGIDQPALFQTPNIFGETRTTNPFGQAATQDKPADNPFAFQPAVAQPPASSLFNFNSTSTDAKPAKNPFAFQSSAPQQPVSSGISFNATTAQDKPASNPFSFLTSQSAPSNLSVGSAAEPAQDKPGNNIFGNLAQPASPSSVFNFGSPAPQDKPVSTSTPFTFGQSSTQPSSSRKDFGSIQATEKPASNIFGTSQQQPTTSENTFAPLGQQSVSPSNVFSTLKSATSPASNLFGNQDQKSVQNTGTLFGGFTQVQSTNSSTISNSKAPATFSTAEAPKAQPPPSTNLFANVSKPAETNASLFGSPSKQSTAVGNLFTGLNKSTTSAPDLFGTLNKPVHQTLAGSDVSGNLTNGTDSKKVSTPDASEASISPLLKQTPSSNIRGPSTSLFSAPSASKSSSAPSTSAISFDATNSSSIAATTGTMGNTLFSPTQPIDGNRGGSQPAPGGMFPNPPQSTQDSSNLTSFLNQPTSSAPPASAHGLINVDSTRQVDNSHLYREMAAASRITEEFMQPLVPTRFNEEQRKEFYVAYRMRALNKAMQAFFTTIALGSEISNAIAYYQEQRLVIMDGSPGYIICSKRKALDEPVQETENPSKRNKHPQTSNSMPLAREQRAESHENPSGSSSQLFSAGTATSKAPFVPSPDSFTPFAAPPASPPKGKRKAEVQLTKEDEEREGQEGRRMKIAKSNSETTGGSNTSNIFKTIIDSPTKASLEKKVKSLPAASKDDAPRFNPFANLPVPSSTETAPNSLSVPLPGSAIPKPFSPISTFGNSSATGTISNTQSTIKPPTFTTSAVNFVAQFSQQATKSEEKLMQEAKAEDMDSDEDEEEWEARWKEKRKAELTSIEELGKSKRASFIGGKFSFGSEDKSGALKPATPGTSSGHSEKSTDASQLPSKKHAAQSSGDSISSSATGSRTPTPGIAGSNTGSVLDGHVSGKPISFGQNIFGHLSDADSGADSRKGSNQDSDSADEESEAEEDSENKDPSYQPASEQSSPSTSPEESGQSIIPAKKPLFESAASKGLEYSGTTPNSGTSTPGGSLFDRITRDSTGNPIRHVSSEEKENAKPNSTANFANTTNPFSRSFDAFSDAPADHTWKPDTPIKFGSNPTVNVTTATPTKQPTPFANLFGNSGSSSAVGSPKPHSNLFGGFTTSKSPSNSAGVGFNFGGGLSTTTSSLFPSAVVSTTTSRATSPGGTTDGDSAAEVDPDAEQQEQINLTIGGPGEEDEEVLHEIRAKALQWSSKHGAKWQTKGVGPLRVLKHKDTGAARILLRADPSGTIVLNKSLLAGVKYEVNEKTIKFPAAGESGKGLETWLLQLKTPQFAQELGKVMENNKPSS